MGGIAPSFLELAVPITAALIYAFIWVASRNFSRVGKILARLVPLGFILPMIVYLASITGSKLETTARAPTSAPPAERSAPQMQEEAARREEDRRRMAAVEERRVAQEAQRRAEMEAQRRAAEEARAKSEQAE